MKSLFSKFKFIVGDRARVNLLSIIIGGAGLLATLTVFASPELNMSFLGENPFAVKRETIESIMAWPFGCLAIVALSLQVVAEILGDDLPPRLRSKKYYCWYSLIVIVAVVLAVGVLNLAGKQFAKSYWWPEVIQSHSEMFSSTKFLIEHDGWRADQLSMKDKLSESSRETNLQAAEQNLAQIEKLLELPPLKSDLRARAARLKIYFDQPQR
ncbi:MAG: hypothetical protein AAB370_10905 [Verrucomicrobiota bacterium]